MSLLITNMQNKTWLRLKLFNCILHKITTTYVSLYRLVLFNGHYTS